MEVHPDAEQKQAHPNEDERQENSVYRTRDRIEIIGKSPDECEKKSSDDNPEARLDESGVTSDLLDTILDLGCFAM